MKTCTIDGCGKRHLARGLCSTHYNQQHQPNRHVKYAITCQTCGATHMTLRKDGRYCSLACRDVGRFRHLRYPVLWSAPQRNIQQPTVRADPPRVFVCGDCPQCGTTFVTKWANQSHCCSECGRKHHRRNRRARECQAPGDYTWTQFMRLFLAFDRCCAYCEQPIDGQPDPEHVVPISRGGANSITNLLPSCRACNCDKRDVLLADWNADRLRRGLTPVRTQWALDDPRVQHLTSLAA